MPRKTPRFQLRTAIPGYTVSTVELPFTHPGGIYETMVFPSDSSGEITDWREQDMNRYETEEEARDGHAKMVTRWTEAAS